MKRLALVAAVVSLAAVPAAGAAAFQAGSDADLPPGVDKQATVAVGTTYNWDGSTATGLNYYYWDPVGAGNVGPVTHSTCDKTAQYYCDNILLEFSNPLTQAEIDAGKKSKTKSVTVTIDTFTPTDGPATDFDLFSFSSDANGTVGDQLDSDGNLQNTTSEVNTFSITTTPTQPSQWVLVRVVYYQVIQGSYKGHARF